MISAIVAALLLAILRRLLARIGFYRIVWHGPLVNVALYILILAAITAGLQRWMS
jgi:protein AaeX